MAKMDGEKAAENIRALESLLRAKDKHINALQKKVCRRARACGPSWPSVGGACRVLPCMGDGRGLYIRAHVKPNSLQKDEEESVAYALTTEWHSTIAPIPEMHSGGRGSYVGPAIGADWWLLEGIRGEVG